MNIKRTLEKSAIWIVLALAVGGGIWGLMQLGAPTAVDGNKTELTEPISAEDWTKGSVMAKVVLVEYSDFQCPACAAYFPYVKQISNKYSDKVLIVYKNYPLPQHQQSKLAATYAEAAGNQGRFWEMHDKLFENQDKWSDNNNAEEIFKGYARELGLNETKLAEDIKSSAIENKIEKDIDSGNKSGVDRTPTFFLNGKKLTELQTLNDLEYYVSQAIK